MKKISTFATTLTTTDVEIDEVGTTAANAVWEVRWSQNSNGHGVTEGGSSGSPLFNQNKLIVGTLTGGSSECSAPTEPDYFGCFSYHWESNGTSSTARLSSWLDPAGTNPTTLGGYDPYSNDVEDNTAASSKAVVYPNPATGKFSIQINLNADMRVDIDLVDITGRIVYQSKKHALARGANELTVTPIGINTGIYVVRMHGYNNNNSLQMKQEAKLIYMNK